MDSVVVTITLDNQSDVDDAMHAVEDAKRGIRRILADMYKDGMYDVDTGRSRRMGTSLAFLDVLAQGFTDAAKASGAKVTKKTEF